MNTRLKKEIEKKFRLENVDKASFIRRLQNLDAKLIDKKKEVDTYFNVAGRDSLTTKECLRVRETDTFDEITYKPPTENFQVVKSHFAKRETNVSVNDGKEATALLECIGNTVLVVVDKEREHYSLDECAVTLDSVKDVGLFVEIEIQADDEESALRKINNVAEKLGLDESMIEVLPYRDVVLNNRS